MSRPRREFRGSSEGPPVPATRLGALAAGPVLFVVILVFVVTLVRLGATVTKQPSSPPPRRKSQPQRGCRRLMLRLGLSRAWSARAYASVPALTRVPSARSPATAVLVRRLETCPGKVLGHTCLISASTYQRPAPAVDLFNRRADRTIPLRSAKPAVADPFQFDQPLPTRR